MSDIINQIIDGHADDQLDGIIGAVTDRRKAIARKQLHSVKVGDRIRITGGIRPKYMVGATGKVVGTTNTRVEVELDEAVGKFGHNGPVGLPPGTFAIINEEG